jgi:Cell wall-active antibiotics response 4TMS YvqF/Domain of unknown function (DUF5668)
MDRGRIFWGALLLVVGLVFLLDRTGTVDAGTLISDWWPLLVIIGGALLLLQSPGSATGPLLVMGAGAILLLSTLDLLDISVWQLLWPLALIGLGVWVLIGRVSPQRGEAAAGDRIDAIAVFGTRRAASSSQSLQGGSMVAVFGGVEVDLSAAALAADGAGIDATAVFGSVDLWVPSGWRVEVSGLPIFGGWDTGGAQNSPPGSPTLRIRALTAFGGLEVKRLPGQSPF